MPITQITIENFKGIGSRVSIPLRPITLLFGANSAGKSTILQAMLYLRELLERRNADADLLHGAGSTMNLGGFSHVVHGHDTTKRIRIGVTIEIDDDGLPEYHFPMWDDVTSSDELSSEAIDAAKEVTVIVEVGCRGEAPPTIYSYTVCINGEEVGSIEAGPIELAQIVLNPESHFSRELFSYLIGEDMLERVAEETKKREPASQNGRRFRLGKNVIPEWGKPLESISPIEADDADYVNLAAVYFKLSRIFVGAGELVLKELQRIRYVGPLRIVPERSFDPVRSPDETRWADGSAAWDILFSCCKPVPDCSDESHWNPLELGYHFSKHAYFEVSWDSDVGRLISSRMTSLVFSEAEPNDQVVIDDDELNQFHFKTRLKIVDSTSGVEVNPCDIGVGVSQVIPILVGAMTSGYSLLAVEQPELHIHPAVQCRLADFLAEQVLTGQERSLLLETHSEHLILRLLRRVRELSEDNLEPGNPEIRPSDLSVLYVTSQPEGLQITELPVSEDGDFDKPWPKGFFEERAAELF